MVWRRGQLGEMVFSVLGTQLALGMQDQDASQDEAAAQDAAA
jgi:hypothetical protein